MLPDISHGRNTFQTRQRKMEGGNHETAGDRYKILQVQMNDENGHHSWIEYFLWELDFGKKNKELQAFRQDNSIIDLSDAGKLYDYLTENKN